jgi:hypothetical protein
MQEKRKNQRVGVSFPVECNLLSGHNYFYTVSKDLSSSGAKILANEFMVKNQTLKLNINFVDRVLNLKGKVIWCNREPSFERYTAGIEFEEVSKENKDYLVSFLG